MKSRSHRFLLVLFLLTALVAAAWIAFLPREPSFRSRSLSEWLDCTPGLWPEKYWYRHTHDELRDRLNGEDNWGLVSRGTDWTTPAELEARDAIRTMGTQTLSALLKMLRSQETIWERLCGKLDSILPQPWRTQTPFTRCEIQRFRASRGFEALGSAALPALSQLSNCLQQPSPDVSVGWALVALGSDAVPALTSALTNADAGVRHLAALSLSSLGSNALPAVPSLVQLLHAPEPATRYHGLLALGRLSPVPTQVIPALIERLRDEKDEGNRLTTVVVLGLSGDRARAAVPLLLELHAESDDPLWRSTIRSALKNIDAASVPPADSASSP